MSCCAPKDEDALRNDALTRDLKAGKKLMEKQLKTLLLGAGESGKSTIFKQMKIIHHNGYSKEECMMFRDIIYGNCLKAMKALVTASLTFGIPIEKQDNCERAQEINALDNEVLLNVGKIWNEQLGRNIKELWDDPGIKKTYERKNEYQLDDSAVYYFSHIDRVNAPDYVPTEQDVLRSRVKTTGIVEMDVKLSNQTVKFLDVGGQRNERKKWIHCFEGVTAIIFVCSLSEYDQKCYEDDSTNRMKESLLLFDEVCNSRWFSETSIVLFLNKVDLFQQKIAKTDLNVCFPEYTGGCSAENGIKFVMKKYQDLNRHKDTKTIYAHVTCATDTDQLKKVFDAIKDIILQKALIDGGIL